MKAYLRSDIRGAVELTSWSSASDKEVVVAAIDHLQPGYDAVEQAEVYQWLAELYEVISDSKGLTSFVAHIRRLPWVDGEEGTRH